MLANRGRDMDNECEDFVLASLYERLKPLVTTEFLTILRYAVRVTGWERDMVETVAFAKGLYALADMEAPGDWTDLLLCAFEEGA